VTLNKEMLQGHFTKIINTLSVSKGGLEQSEIWPIPNGDDPP